MQYISFPVCMGNPIDYSYIQVRKRGLTTNGCTMYSIDYISSNQTPCMHSSPLIQYNIPIACIIALFVCITKSKLFCN